ncbi:MULTISPECIES: antitoxin [Asaia]|uniref:antitoxin n=1 Tax=Asaia TaxID=91914 RepID=UPI002555DA36|nr:AbrB/MazE/SpoVT family DNA-binding domain-containing protein [Asaia sp. HumB]MDL2172495.1 AbrB/MazE/SpoVT family DNA-binding domain-containing protein [Asaia sp. HumB]
MMDVEGIMTQTARIFTNGRSQVVRLPASFQFEGTEVYIYKDEVTGDVSLSRRPESWVGLFAAIKDGGVPNDFLSTEDRSQHEKARDPFTGITPCAQNV